MFDAHIQLPEPSLVVLMGASGSGKSTFARTHFHATEVVSSDACRALVADDENDQSATPAAFDVLHCIVGHRLAGGRLTVVDATNVRPRDRSTFVELARKHHVPLVALVLDLPTTVCLQRNQTRTDRTLPVHVVRAQSEELRRGLAGLGDEGFGLVTLFDSAEQVAAATITRRRPVPSTPATD